MPGPFTMMYSTAGSTWWIETQKTTNCSSAALGWRKYLFVLAKRARCSGVPLGSPSPTTLVKLESPWQPR
jgi:hypothetical protein